MDVYEKTIYMRPFPAPRMVDSDKWANRPCVSRYRYNSTQLYNELRLLWFKPNIIHLVFVFKLPQNAYKKDGVTLNKKGQALINKPHKQRPDIDNMVKAVLDTILNDDSAVHTISASKLWGEQDMIIFKAIKDID